MAGKPRGYHEYVLFADCETTGLAFGCDNPTIDPTTGKTYQAISWGLIVAESTTLKVVDELYVEIKWNGTSEWTASAQKIHGLSLEYLEEHGMDEADAVVEIGNLIVKYWGPTSNIVMGGHNVHKFDLQFLQATMRSQGIELNFGSKHVDTNSIGFATYGTYNSDDLFELVGLNRATQHNALEDARCALKTVKRVRSMWEKLLDGDCE